MSDYTLVQFTALEKAFNVPSILFSFSLFGNQITVHFYGAIIAFGFLLAVLLGGRIAYTWKMSLDKMVDVLIYGTIAGIIGARLYYVFSKWDYYGQHPADIFKIWEGGLAIYGGLIAGIIGAFIVCKVRKLNFLNLLDCCAISFLVGQGIGRWGNFVNQEAFGTNTKLPWGMYSSKTSEYLTTHFNEITAKGISIDPYAPVHPTFLYESVWCLIGVVVLYLVCRKFRKFSGQMILWYGVWYGAERAVVEGLRTDSLYLGSTGIRTSQLISIIIAAVSLALLIYFTRKYTKNPKPIDGIDYFSDKQIGGMDFDKIPEGAKADEKPADDKPADETAAEAPAEPEVPAEESTSAEPEALAEETASEQSEDNDDSTNDIN